MAVRVLELLQLKRIELSTSDVGHSLLPSPAVTPALSVVLIFLKLKSLSSSR